MMISESLLVVESPYKNYTHTLSDDVYLVQFDNPEEDEYDFQTSVIQDNIRSNWELEPAGSITIPLYKAKKK